MYYNIIVVVSYSRTRVQCVFVCARVCVRVRSYNESSIGIGSTTAAVLAFEENDLRSRSQGPGTWIDIQFVYCRGTVNHNSGESNGNRILSNVRGDSLSAAKFYKRRRPATDGMRDGASDIIRVSESNSKIHVRAVQR